MVTRESDWRWEYVGDGVYAGINESGIQLRINDMKNPTDVVQLDWRTLEDLSRVIDILKTRLETKTKTSQPTVSPSQKLDEYIKKLEDHFPSFEYKNATKGGLDGIMALSDEFAIIVRGVPVERITEVRKFIRDEIYSCVDDNEPLPCVITLQNYSKSYTQNPKNKQPPH